MASETKPEDKDVKSDSVSKIAAPWEASSHALYLHHSDQPRAVLVAQPLMEDNFSKWMQSMSDALKIKNKIGFVLASMSKQISKSVKNCKTSREVWLDLQERFLQTNTVQLFNIENAFHDCTQGSYSVTTFYTKLKSLWDDRDVLCNVAPCGCGLDEFIKNQKTMKFLMGLNENFSILRGTIVAIDQLPTGCKAYSMALRHEKQLEAAGGGKTAAPQEGAVFAVKKTTHEDDPEKQEHRCGKCGKKHLTSKCRQHMQCTYCDRIGLTVDYCNKKKADLEKQSKGSINSLRHVKTIRSDNGAEFKMPSYYTSKGYKVFDIEEERIFVSRDVLFHEDVFPFKPSTSSYDPKLSASSSGSRVSTTSPQPSQSSAALHPDSAETHSPQELELNPIYDTE
ncbi:hypothetical protein ACLB2K_002795 [Fragaria x ananassa]